MSVIYTQTRAVAVRVQTVVKSEISLPGKMARGVLSAITDKSCNVLDILHEILEIHNVKEQRIYF